MPRYRAVLKLYINKRTIGRGETFSYDNDEWCTWALKNGIIEAIEDAPRPVSEFELPADEDE